MKTKLSPAQERALAALTEHGGWMKESEWGVRIPTIDALLMRELIDIRIERNECWECFEYRAKGD